MFIPFISPVCPIGYGSLMPTTFLDQPLQTESRVSVVDKNKLFPQIKLMDKNPEDSYNSTKPMKDNQKELTSRVVSQLIAENQLTNNLQRIEVELTALVDSGD